MNKLGHGPWEKDYQPSGISRKEYAASLAAYAWQSDDEGKMSLEMFPEPFKRGFIQGYEQAEKDLALKFKKLREAQKKWKKTLNYGWRCEALRLEKQVDELLNEIDGE